MPGKGTEKVIFRQKKFYFEKTTFLRLHSQKSSSHDGKKIFEMSSINESLNKKNIFFSPLSNYFDTQAHARRSYKKLCCSSSSSWCRIKFQKCSKLNNNCARKQKMYKETKNVLLWHTMVFNGRVCLAWPYVALYVLM